MSAELDKPAGYELDSLMLEEEAVVGDFPFKFTNWTNVALIENPYQHLEQTLDVSYLRKPEALMEYWTFFNEVAAPNNDADIHPKLKSEAHQFIRNELRSGKSPEQIMERAERQAGVVAGLYQEAAEEQGLLEAKEANRLTNRIKKILPKRKTLD